MFKEKKKILIITLIVTVIPMIVGLILWNKLPETIATHFDAQNNPNGWSSKAFTVFVIPAILTALQALMFFIISNDPKKKNISIKGLNLVIWIIPITSIIVGAVVYAQALGFQLNIALIACLFAGILFILLGILLPKNSSNYSFGIRTPWALNDEENWNYTNKIGGYCFVAGGILIIIFTLIGKPVLLFPVVILVVLIPVLASYIYFKKHKTE